MTEYGRIPSINRLRKNRKSPNPELNVHHRCEDVATDIVFYDTRDIYNYIYMAKVYILFNRFVSDIYPVKPKGQIIN